MQTKENMSTFYWLVRPQSKLGNKYLLYVAYITAFDL